MQRCRRWKRTAGCWYAVMRTQAPCWKLGWKRWPGAEKVFDFGALSYADAKMREKLSAKSLPRERRAHSGKTGPCAGGTAFCGCRLCRRVCGARRGHRAVSGQPQGLLGAHSGKHGCTGPLAAGHDPSCCIRSAAGGGDKLAKIRQGGPGGCADGADACRTSRKTAAPAKPPRKRHRVRNALIFLLVLTLAAFAAAWYYTGGDLTALPQRLQSLGADSLPHAGAKLI